MARREFRDDQWERIAGLLPGKATDRIGVSCRKPLVDPGADCTQALPLLEGVPAGAVLGDTGDDTDAIVSAIAEAGSTAVIPPRTMRKESRDCDYALYKERNLVERDLQSHPALPRHSHPLRKAGREFQSPSLPRSHDRLDGVIVNRA